MLNIRTALLCLLLMIVPAFGQAPPPIPAIPDTDRIVNYNISVSTASVPVPFAVFGDCSDIQVQINGVPQPLPSSLWNCTSQSGALNTLPLPIIDMMVNYTPALTTGTTTITGAWHPRNLTVPTKPGISRREYEQTFSTLVSAQRELSYEYGALFAAGVTPLSPLLDSTFSSTQGSILYRGASAWLALGPGTSGQVLETLGASANPAWASVLGTGSVTNVATGTGLTGGAITASGTIALASATDSTVKSNISGGAAAPIDNTPTAILDYAFGSTQGNVLYRGASAWASLAHGTAGQTLISGGVAANPSWATSTVPAPTTIVLGGVLSSSASAGQCATGIDLSGHVTYATCPYGSIAAAKIVSNITGSPAAPIGNTQSAIFDSVFSATQGSVLYRSGSAWTALAVGTNGQVLTTGGIAANPSWTTVTGTGTVTSVATGTGLTGGAITTTGTVSLATATSLTVKSNVTGGAAVPIDNNLTDILDATLGNSQGSVIFRDAAVWNVLTPGLSGQVLTTSGAGANPSWVSFSSGRDLLNTLTASGSANLGDTTSLTNAYSEYDIVFENVIAATNATSCEIQLHSGGTFKTTTYSTLVAYVTGSSAGESSTTTFIPCSYPSQSSNAGPGISGTITIYTPSNTTAEKMTLGKFGAVNNSSVLLATTVSGVWAGGNGAVDGFQVLFSAGNITSGTIKVYGVN